MAKTKIKDIRISIKYQTLDGCKVTYESSVLSMAQDLLNSLEEETK